MGRLNLRPIYDRDEPVPGEGVARGIGQALGAYAQHQDEGRLDENRRRAAGQVMTTRGEGGFDRLRSLGRRLTGRGDAPVSATPPPTFTQPQVSGRVLPMTGFSNEASQPPAMMGGVTLAQTPNHAAPTPPVVPATPAPRAARTIGTALDAYTEQDNNGNTWTVDPNREANRSLAAHDAQTRNELDMKDEYKTRSENDAADAYARAKQTGDERDIGAFRAKTGTFKYDEEFGAPRPQQHETPEQRAARDSANIEKRGAIQERIARLTASGRGNSPEVLELRRQALDLSRDRLDMQRTQGEDRVRSGDVTRSTTLAGAMTSALPKDPLGIAPPDVKAQIDRGTKARDKQLAGAVDANKRVVNSHATREAAAARAKALRAAGASPESIRTTMISEGYRIH